MPHWPPWEACKQESGGFRLWPPRTLCSHGQISSTCSHTIPCMTAPFSIAGLYMMPSGTFAYRPVNISIKPKHLNKVQPKMSMFWILSAVCTTRPDDVTCTWNYGVHLHEKTAFFMVLRPQLVCHWVQMYSLKGGGVLFLIFFTPYVANHLVYYHVVYTTIKIEENDI